MAQIHERMVKIMRALSAIGKSQESEFGSYRFRGVDDVYNALHPILAEQGVFAVPEVMTERSEERSTKGGGVLIYRICLIKYTFYSEDGSNVAAIVIGEGMDPGDKAGNKAMAAAHKYTLLQCFCIPTKEGGMADPDKNEHQVKGKAKAAASKQRVAAAVASGPYATGEGETSAGEAGAAKPAANAKLPDVTELTELWTSLGWNANNWQPASDNIAAYDFGGPKVLRLRQIPKDKLVDYRDYLQACLDVKRLWVELGWEESLLGAAVENLAIYDFGDDRKVSSLHEIPQAQAADYRDYLQACLDVKRLWVELGWDQKQQTDDMLKYNFGTVEPIDHLSKMPADSVDAYTTYLAALIEQRANDALAKKGE